MHRLIRFFIALAIAAPLISGLAAGADASQGLAQFSSHPFPRSMADDLEFNAHDDDNGDGNDDEASSADQPGDSGLLE